MGRLIFLIRVSRPIVWPFLPLVYLLGMHSANVQLSFAAVLQMAMLTFPMNVIGCGLNDIFDYDSDRLCGRRLRIWGAVVGEAGRPVVWRAALWMTPLVLLSAVVTRSGWNMVATAGLVGIAWAYSVPPVRLKERPPLDSLANGLGYFLLPLAMGYSLGRAPSEMPLRYYLLALCVSGIHALAAAADFDVDGAAGHRTIAVAYGRRTAAAFAFVTFLAALVTGDFMSLAVRGYLAICTGATLLAVILPSARTIAVACVIIFAGFLIAAPLHVLGW